MDTSRVEHLFLKENYLLGLNFPVDGIIPLRILAKEVINFSYQAVTKTNEGSITTTGTIAADTQVDSSKLSFNAYNIDNIIRVLDCAHIYQMFVGIKPSAIKQYLYYPAESAQKGLDQKPIFSKSPYGYIDGFESPYDKPSPQTEMWIPKGIDVGFSWYNPLSTAEQVDLNLLIVKYLVKVVRDGDIVEGMIKGNTPMRIATIGGLDGVNYNPRPIFGTDLIPFDAPREDIDAALLEK